MALESSPYEGSIAKNSLAEKIYKGKSGPLSSTLPEIRMRSNCWDIIPNYSSLINCQNATWFQ